MKSVLVSVLVLVVLFISFSCNEGYDFSQASLGLGLRDYSCTEAWIEVQIGSNDKTADIYIKKNDEIIKTIRIGQSDSLFYFDSLQPNTAYKFDAVTYEDGKEVKSNPVTFTTLDTTSHNFTFETFTFGQHSSSTLYDVAIINENNIWAVGEIYMNDSLGNPDQNAYNAVHWNGQNWEPKRIYYYGACSAVTYPPLTAIWAFDANNIVVTNGGSIGWFNGNSVNLDCRINPLLTGAINKMWGSSSNDLYAVGNNGNIAHYNGSRWTNIESGTTTNINDAWGIFDNGTSTVYCPVSSVFNPPQDKKILKITNDKVDSISWDRDIGLNSAWTNNENFLYVCGEGVYVNKFGNWNEIVLQPVGTNSIRGNGINDIFIDGDYGFIAHFNGKSWHIYNNNYLKGYSRLSFKGDIVAIAGNYQGKAIIEIGRRN